MRASAPLAAAAGCDRTLRARVASSSVRALLARCSAAASTVAISTARLQPPMEPASMWVNLLPRAASERLIATVSRSQQLPSSGSSPARSTRSSRPPRVRPPATRRSTSILTRPCDRDDASLPAVAPTERAPSARASSLCISASPATRVRKCGEPLSEPSARSRMPACAFFAASTSHGSGLRSCAASRSASRSLYSSTAVRASATRGTTPRSPPGNPRIVYVLPEPVAPYESTQPVPPSHTCSTSELQCVHTSSCVQSGGRTASTTYLRAPPPRGVVGFRAGVRGVGVCAAESSGGGTIMWSGPHDRMLGTAVGLMRTRTVTTEGSLAMEESAFEFKVTP
eukprot:6497512-Prymnesium_polylepis.2